jgi:hypothetical protein
MLRSTLVKANLTKAPANPGPTLQGWGRSVQKRRLEYETVNSKYGKREFTKNWDLVGLTQRSTDFMEIRTYFNFGSRMGTWLFNWGQFTVLAFVPGAGFILTLHAVNKKYDESIHRAAWW